MWNKDHEARVSYGVAHKFEDVATSYTVHCIPISSCILFGESITYLRTARSSQDLGTPTSLQSAIHSQGPQHFPLTD